MNVLKHDRPDDTLAKTDKVAAFHRELLNLENELKRLVANLDAGEACLKTLNLARLAANDFASAGPQRAG